ncbi:LLM class flavin-dependent oxidoreductase [Cryobacterium melibiosiphilum]|uniref:LLM class flavin-dependent oxidoreductase n=1 Tax=Cryobacterium melibiosiphilum TaxID=995039 RepID=A0A3A5MLC8_9MICO|nr:LLM class flavin-dependent oxidoreductase [Cryobacterium melibiosiphilum]RJT87653.1 LLM class flavin-dependent oxidoreductase [Cryobacterium melibiosiphilum]
MTIPTPFELGIFTFGELTRSGDGSPIAPEQRLRDLLEWARVADDAGLDVFGVGEHHRPDFAVSSPAVVLVAAAAQTRRIRLTSTVTVLSSADPVRVFEDFATLDLLSAGRAELTAGRGAHLESFPLFGQDLNRYDEYFEDRLDLLLRLRDENPVTWSGTTRAPLTNAGVWPRPTADGLPIWLAVGGTRGAAHRPDDVLRPPLSRAGSELADAGAELVLVCSSWVPGADNAEQWRILAQARAIENSYFVGAVSECPPISIRRSLLADPAGRLFAELGLDADLVIREIDGRSCTRHANAIPPSSTGAIPFAPERVSDRSLYG